MASIVTKDADRLVREGGVVNRGEVQIHTPPTPFDVDVCSPSPKYHPDVHDVAFHRGTVTVVDVHHADECYISDHDVEMIERTGPYLVGWPYCHDDAQPGMWHWVVEPKP